MQVFQESAKSHCNTSPSNQTKISLSNNNFAIANRNKHPTHIPYDPHLHRNSKPPYSFSCLIFMAIEDSPVKALPVKEVYAWILDRFPYFRNAPTGWKNSVRHNLSLNKCFRKVEKTPVSAAPRFFSSEVWHCPKFARMLLTSDHHCLALSRVSSFYF